MNFKFVLPIISINFDIQTKFGVNQTQIGHSIPKKTPKTHQSGHISKPHFAQVSFTKKPTSTNLSETFRINVNMDFAHTNYILVFWPHFCSEASHGHCCTYGLKTTLKLLVDVLAIMASSCLKIVFLQKS